MTSPHLTPPQPATCPNVKTLTVSEVCYKLGISSRTLSRWCKSRRIGFFKVGGVVRFTQESVDAIIAKHSIKSIV